MEQTWFVNREFDDTNYQMVFVGSVCSLFVFPYMFAQIRIFPFSAIQLTSYPLFKSLLNIGESHANANANANFGRMFVAGCFAGITATFSTCDTIVFVFLDISLIRLILSCILSVFVDAFLSFSVCLSVLCFLCPDVCLQVDQLQHSLHSHAIAQRSVSIEKPL